MKLETGSISKLKLNFVSKLGAKRSFRRNAKHGRQRASESPSHGLELSDNFFISRVSAIACLSAASEPIHHLGKQLDLVCVNDPARIMRRQAALPVIRYSHEVSPSAQPWPPYDGQSIKSQITDVNAILSKDVDVGRTFFRLPPECCFQLTKLDSISHEIQSIAPSFDDVFLVLQL
jgi:hypothetical protein